MAPIREAQNYLIVITDDDTSCREALREIVEPEGFRILLAESGEEMLDIVRDSVVHLALLDMHMPTLTGLETLQMARQINARLPAILVTGDASESVVRQAYQAQVFSVIPKPVSRAIVLHTVVRALTRFYGIFEPFDHSQIRQEPKNLEAPEAPEAPEAGENIE